MTYEPFLQTLTGMHLNTAHIGEIRGYTDHPELYARYPLKRFSKLDTQRYGAWDKLKEVHAVEFLGEPQYGGGRPVPPMEVHRALLPYRNSRLATTVTHSEERIWRFYAGLSDFLTTMRIVSWPLLPIPGRPMTAGKESGFAGEPPWKRSVR